MCWCTVDVFGGVARLVRGVGWRVWWLSGYDVWGVSWIETLKEDGDARGGLLLLVVGRAWT